MELERIASAVRPRSRFEAMDLGFRLAQSWWWPVLRAWLMSALPVFLVLCVLFWRQPQWVALLFWWLKPLFERAPLAVLAEAQFGAIPSAADTRKTLWKHLTAQLLPTLTIRRLSLSRSVKAPLLVLEKLSGQARNQRISQLIDSKTRRSGHWLTTACAHFEAIFNIAALLLLAGLVPEGMDWNRFELMAEPQPWMTRLFNLLYFLSVALIAPFYVAGGFSLYLNRRTELEGWDIEIQFRRLKKRLSAAPTALALLLAVTLLGAAPDSHAAVPPAALPADDAPTPEHAEARKKIRAILAGKEFHTLSSDGRWEARQKDKKAEQKSAKSPKETSAPTRQEKDTLQPFIQNLAAGFKFVIWAGLGGLLIYLLLRYRGVLARLPGMARRPARRVALPLHVAGLDIRPESLPSDVLTTVHALHEQGQSRAALSLLYRAALAELAGRHDLPLRSSHTEQEVLTLAQPMLEDAAPYFEQLTHAWQRLAYGHLQPGDAEWTRLTQGWPQYFGATRRVTP